MKSSASMQIRSEWASKRRLRVLLSASTNFLRKLRRARILWRRSWPVVLMRQRNLLSRVATFASERVEQVSQEGRKGARVNLLRQLLQAWHRRRNHLRLL